MSQQRGISFKEFRQRFQTEEACEAYLFEQRWPDGFVCPKCGGYGCYRLHARREYVCKQCRRQSSSTVGTVLHRTHLPLMVWFWAIYLVAQDKRGITTIYGKCFCFLCDNIIFVNMIIALSQPTPKYWGWQRRQLPIFSGLLTYHDNHIC